VEPTGSAPSARNLAATTGSRQPPSPPTRAAPPLLRAARVGQPERTIHAVTFTYDSINHVSTMKPTDGFIYSYSYDGFGNLV
jgi:hypothetical protein